MRIGRHHAQFLLIGEDLVAHRVPAHVELALELVDPFLRRLVRGVRAAGDVVDEERLVRRGCVQILQVPDGVVGHVGGEVIAGVADPRIHCVVLRNR